MTATPIDPIPLQDVDAELHIASFVVHARPGALNAVRNWLLDRPGVEIHAEDPCGKLVVVMEHPQHREIPALIDAVQQQPGVLSAALVYHEIVPPEDVTP